MTFDNLWEQEELQGLQQRLQREYPAWQRRRRNTLTTVASIAVLVAIAVPSILYTLPTKQYDFVACNRSGIADDHWVDVAANILISNCGI